MSYRFDVRMAKDQDKRERFLDDLDGEVRSFTPNVTIGPFWIHQVGYLYVRRETPRKD